MGDSLRMNEGPVQRGNGKGGPTTPKPVILPKGQASARTALAEQQKDGPAVQSREPASVVGESIDDAELDELFTEIDGSGEPLSWRAYARAVLARRSPSRSCRDCQHWRGNRCVLGFPDPIEEGLRFAADCESFLK